MLAVRNVIYFKHKRCLSKKKYKKEELYLQNGPSLIAK